MRVRGVAREEAAVEHLEARDAEPLRARVALARARLRVCPRVARAGVEEDGDDAEVDEASADLLRVWGALLRLPPRDEGLDAGSAGVERPAAAVRGNLQADAQSK